jgi:hypothetical protein
MAVCNDSVVVIDLSVRKDYRLPKLDATTYANDRNGVLFTCKNNRIEEIFVNFTRNSTVDTSNSGNILNS